MKSQFLKSLQYLELQAKEKPMRWKDVFEALGDRCHLILILFLTLPFLQPVPLPGLSTLFAGAMIFLVFLNFFGKPVKLPQKWSQKLISQGLLGNLLKAAEKILNFLERFLKARWPIFVQSIFFKGFNVLVICIQALLLALPLPVPFSNKIPAFTIAVLVIGELEEDGLLVVTSYLLSILSIAFFAGLGLTLKSGWNYIG